MSSQITQRLAVYGYTRTNFDKKCWIDEIIAIIIQFYMIKGGSLYVCGYGDNGRLGIAKYKNKTCKTLTLCPPFTNNNAFKVSAGQYHTLILDTEGNVWCCGDGEEGQLGNGTLDCLYVPTKLNLRIRVMEVSAGRCHSLFLCDDGAVKGCGSNYCGQIGLGDLEKTLVPQTIETLIKYNVAQISAGGAHSAVFTEDGDLFCFGYNLLEQCGVGKDKGKYIKTPTKVDLDDEVEFVDCGEAHTLVITRKSLLYSFGNGNFGKLGHGNYDTKYVPTLIDTLKEKKMKMCAAGYRHSLCIDEKGIIWSFGDNEEGQCGLSEDVEDQSTPKVMEWFIKNNIKVKECFAGHEQSSVISNDGCLYSFGRNNKYQLGLKEDKEYYTPTQLSIPQNLTMQSISMGHQHTAIICSGF